MSTRPPAVFRRGRRVKCALIDHRSLLLASRSVIAAQSGGGPAAIYLMAIWGSNPLHRQIDNRETWGYRGWLEVDAQLPKLCDTKSL